MSFIKVRSRGTIFSLEQKLDSLASTGVELCVLIDFSPDFGKQSGEQFLSKLSQAGVRFLCIGPNLDVAITWTQAPVIW